MSFKTAIERFDLPQLLRLSTVLAVGAIVGQTWWSIQQDRQLAIDAEQRNGQVTVGILEAHAALSFKNAEQKLATIATTVRTMSATESEVRGIVLAHELRGNPYLSALQFINGKGEAWTNVPDKAAAGPSGAASMPHIAYLLAHRGHDAVVVGRPYQNSYDTTVAVPLARNLFDDEGRNIGILSTDIRLAFFNDTYTPMARANGAVISLFAVGESGGYVILDAPSALQAAGRDIKASSLVRTLTGKPRQGSVDDDAFYGDGVARMLAYRRVGGLPLVLTYGRDYGAVLAAWKERTRDRVLFSAAMLSVFLLLVWLAIQQMNRLGRSRAALQESQRALTVLNAELEERIQQRTAKLELSNAELAVALSSLKLVQAELFRAEKMAALGSLVSGIAHELNTPIGIALTMASSMQEQARGMRGLLDGGKVSKGALGDFVAASESGSDILLRSMDRAVALIQTFKEVAVDQAGMERRRFDLRMMLMEVVAATRSLYRDRRCHLQVEVPENIQCDSFPGALSRVMVNVISNAVMHGFDGRERGNMVLSARLVGQDQVEITFIDDGVGIAPDNLKRVCDPFFTTKLGQGGSGLGMHIAYNLVTSILQGSITIGSVLGHGTQVAVILPLCPAGLPQVPVPVQLGA